MLSVIISFGLLLNVDHSKVNLYNTAVYSHTGLLDMVMTRESHPMMSVYDHRKVIGNNSVFCYTMDDMIDMGVLPTNIDFLKIDVEGVEVEIFDGLSDENISRVNRLAIETHLWSDNEEMNKRRVLVEDVQNRLVRLFDHHWHGYYGRGSVGGWTETLNLWRD